MSSPESSVRKWIFGATSKLPILSDSLKAGLAAGAHDTDADVAAVALGVIGARKDLNLTYGEWHFLLHSLAAAQRSLSIPLRIGGALANRRLRDLAPDGDVKDRLEELVKLFSEDVSWSVRRAFLS